MNKWSKNYNNPHGGEDQRDKSQLYKSNESKVDILQLITLSLNDKREGKEYSEFLKELETFMAHVKNVSGSQIRKLYELAEKLPKQNSSERAKTLFKIRILVEYAYKRKNISEAFYKFLNQLVDKTLEDVEKAVPFKETMEAIVAFSKKG